MTKGAFFCICLSQHRILGAVFTAHIATPLKEGNGIFSIIENLNSANLTKWSNFVSSQQKDIVSLLSEFSDAALLKNLGKKHKTVAEFYKEVENNSTLGDYTKQYVERRMSRCFDLIAESQTPTFIKEKNFNNIYDHNLLQIAKQNAIITFHFARNSNETLYQLKAQIGSTNIELRNSDTEVVCNNPCIVRIGKQLVRFCDIEAKKLSPFFSKSHVSIPKQSELKYFETFILNSIKNFKVEAEGFQIDWTCVKPSANLVLEPTLSGELGLILEFIYGEKRYLSHTIPQREVYFENQNNEYIFRCFERNIIWEKEIIERLTQFGLEPYQGAEFKPTQVNREPFEKGYSIIEWINAKRSNIEGIGVGIVTRNTQVPYYIGNCELNFNSKFENDWFDIYGTIRLDSFEIPLLKLKRNIVKGIREFELPNGEIFILPQHWFEKYRMLVSVSHENENENAIRLRAAQFETIVSLGIENKTASELYKKFEGLSAPLVPAIPAGLNASLRKYQEKGLLWLQILYNNKMGGCLADDMGLGKTLQTIAQLVHIKNCRAENEEHRPSLIVVPTSLVFNWEQEFEKFAPTLKVFTYTGSNRNKTNENWYQYDAIITTYGIVRNDIEYLMNCMFNYIILDESHNIKNPTSKIYRAVMLLKGGQYLALSGTPIENSLLDLWSILNFLNRGILGSIRFFKEEFLIPIVEQNDANALKRLKKIVTPFILRRTKHEVAADLPNLTQQTLVCNLTDEQQQIYEKEKIEVQKEILKSIEDIGYKKSALQILRSLTRLRQIANHPKLVNPLSASDSGKFSEICSSVKTITSEGHKVLIFSSFVKHLNLVEEFIVNEQLPYSKLIGSTKNRKEVVEQFKSSNCKIFLISLKAGGTGLNLTSADYVFVLDPWWNPAAEEQAIARAHRIGRDKPVFVYRFISAQTVEEKIQALQKRKMSLSTEIVGSLNPLDLIEQNELLNIIG